MRRAATLTLSLLSVISFAQAAHLEAKAWLGQLLIARAWQQQLRGIEAPRPWPWADTQPVARLQVPALGVDLIVLAGGTGYTLAWGPGHLAGTAPLGAPGNAVVSGHRDTHFAFLRDLVVGTELRVQDGAGRWHPYRVTRSFVTHERDPRVVAASEGSRLTLVTCWPFDALLPGGTDRYVVVAQQIDPTAGRPAGSHRADR